MQKSVFTSLIMFIALISSAVVNAQKIIEVSKSDIKENNQKIADYDGKGGILSNNRYIWVLSPGTTDTLLTITPIIQEFENPLFETDIFFKMNFHDAAHSVFLLRNPPGWGAVGERKILSLIFNDKNPKLIEAGKLSDAGIAAFKTQVAFDYDKLMESDKQIKEQVQKLNGQVVARDKTKPLSQDLTSDKKLIQKLHVVDAYVPMQRIIITQDGKRIGIYEKEVTGGSFAKASYRIYKFISPITISGVQITALPIAVSQTAPGVTSTNTGNEITIKLIGTGKEIKIPPAAYDMAGTGILNALIANGIL